MGASLIPEFLPGLKCSNIFILGQTQLFHAQTTYTKAIKLLSKKNLLTKEIFWSIICF